MRQVAFPGGKTSCLVCARRARLFRGDVYLVAPLTKEAARAPPEAGRFRDGSCREGEQRLSWLTGYPIKTVTPAEAPGFRVSRIRWGAYVHVHHRNQTICCQCASVMRIAVSTGQNHTNIATAPTTKSHATGRYGCRVEMAGSPDSGSRATEPSSSRTTSLASDISRAITTSASTRNGVNGSA